MAAARAPGFPLLLPQGLHLFMQELPFREQTHLKAGVT